jgi:hypothetical protein
MTANMFKWLGGVLVVVGYCLGDIFADSPIESTPVLLNAAVLAGFLLFFEGLKKDVVNTLLRVGTSSRAS